jgi:hypothetical protein
VLDAITSVPAVAGVALTTAAFLIRDMLDGEKLRPAEGSDAYPQGAPSAQVASRMRYRSYGLAFGLILFVLVVLRFITLAG